MKELNYTPFNHGYLCETLRFANDEQLDNILLDVCKEQHRRKAEKKESFTIKIQEAIREAVKAGYEVNIYFSNDDEEDPFLTIHANNEILMEVELKEEEE